MSLGKEETLSWGKALSLCGVLSWCEALSRCEALSWCEALSLCGALSWFECHFHKEELGITYPIISLASYKEVTAPSGLS